MFELHVVVLPIISGAVTKVEKKLYEALLAQKSLADQAAFCWSAWQICVTNLKPDAKSVGKSHSHLKHSY